MSEEFNLRCQGCLKELDNRFEEERQLCHKCFVVSQESWEKALMEARGK